MRKKRKTILDIKEKIKKIVKKRVKINEPMSKHTTFHIGGQVDCLIKVINIKEIKSFISLFREAGICLRVIGEGSNILVLDKGISGVILKLDGEFNKIQIKNRELITGAGVRLAFLVKKCLDNKLTGLEFLAGIPGTVGGAIMMNAGIGKEGIGNLIEEIEVIQKDGSINLLRKEDLIFSYRKSNIPKDNIIIKARLLLKKVSKNDILTKIKSRLQKRLSTQPWNTFNAGCIFKNPHHDNQLAAGDLIEQVGLKGIKRGEAQVSRKHANFIVNLKNAQAKDVLYLINKIRKKVKEKFGIELEREIEIWG